MNAEEITHYCLSKPGVTSGFPFNNDTLVFKVKEKVFCLMRLNQSPVAINVKCEPEQAIELRENYAAITPGYHMNKDHWNTITIDGSIPKKMIQQFIDKSYSLVNPIKTRKS